MTAPSHTQPAVGSDSALPSDHPAPQIRVASPAAAASLAGLATVELQLIMQHYCDLSTLLALARCSRFTLHAASDPFAWRALSPLSWNFVHPLGPDTVTSQQRPKISAWQRLRCCIRPPPPSLPLLPPPLPLSPSLAQRLSVSLLRFCDFSINWYHDRRSLSPVTAAELDALAAIPRLRMLNSCGRWTAGPVEIAALARRPGLRGLTTLACHGLDGPSIRALAEHCPKLSTVATMGSNGIDPPLHTLPALTDLTVRVNHAGGLTMAGVLRCAGLRRLNIRPDLEDGFTSRDAHAALFSPSLRSLEYLAVHGLDALHADGRNQPAVRLDWAAAFAQLPALRSLHLADPRGIDELLAAIGAGCAQLHSLRVHCIEVDFGDSTGIRAAFPSAAALSSLLARLLSLRSVALLLASRERFIGAPSPMDERTRENIWRRAHDDLSALAALHPQRLSADFLSGY